jgi:hypothetical protein
MCRLFILSSWLCHGLLLCVCFFLSAVLQAVILGWYCGELLITGIRSCKLLLDADVLYMYSFISKLLFPYLLYVWILAIFLMLCLLVVSYGSAAVCVISFDFFLVSLCLLRNWHIFVVFQ